MLIERIELNIRGETEQTEITIFWHGGFTSRHHLYRTIKHYGQRSDFDRLLARILELKQTHRNLTEVAE